MVKLMAVAFVPATAKTRQMMCREKTTFGQALSAATERGVDADE